MITQTDRFAAAGAGAPVSNMTSAYGGIRWGSGVTRQMQYEHGQSRIGDNLWDGFDLYVENSPLFFVRNVTTPVLIMHNDEDGAVPWYQGIEFFTALRRCGKQAWMLTYNGEDHNLVQRYNCKDYTPRAALQLQGLHCQARGVLQPFPQGRAYAGMDEIIYNSNI